MRYVMGGESSVEPPHVRSIRPADVLRAARLAGRGRRRRVLRSLEDRDRIRCHAQLAHVQRRVHRVHRVGVHRAGIEARVAERRSRRVADGRGSAVAVDAVRDRVRVIGRGAPRQVDLPLDRAGAARLARRRRRGEVGRRIEDRDRVRCEAQLAHVQHRIHRIHRVRVDRTGDETGVAERRARRLTDRARSRRRGRSGT